MKGINCVTHISSQKLDTYQPKHDYTPSKPARPPTHKKESKPRQKASLNKSKSNLTDVMNSVGLNPRKLGRYLVGFGTYPNTYRSLIWRYLLKLPENRHASDSLHAHGIHPSLKQFKDKFPIKTPQLADATHKVLSALAHWSPLFAGNVDYLPHLVFPLVKVLCPVNQVLILELTVAVIHNYCQKWWEYFPNPPLECLEVIDSLLARYDPALHTHLNVIANAPPYTYTWPMIQSLLSECLYQDAWLHIWDNIVTMTITGPLPFRSCTSTKESTVESKRGSSQSHNTADPSQGKLPPPTYLYLATVAFLRHFRTALLHIHNADHVRDWVTTARPCSAPAITNMMHTMARDLVYANDPIRARAARTSAGMPPLQRSEEPPNVGLIQTPASASELAHLLKSLFAPFCPLPPVINANYENGPGANASLYPPLTQYPHAILHYSSTLHERLRADEAATLRARRAVRDLRRLQFDLDRDAAAWKTADIKSHGAMRDWWDHVLSTETQSWERARAARSELRTLQLQAVDAVSSARSHFLDEAQKRADEMGRVSVDAVTRARMLANMRSQDAQDDQNVRAVQAEWRTRWTELKRAREHFEMIEREQLSHLVHTISGLPKTPKSV